MSFWIENHDISAEAEDSYPEYSNAGDNGITQVGEDATFSVYLEDNLELDVCYFWLNNTGSGVNHTLSVSGVSSWANKTLQLNFTSGNRIEYRWYFSDNASQWVTTSLYYLLTTPLYITFNLNNNTMGNFYVNDILESNQTTIDYNYNESINLVGGAFSNFTFLNFTWINDFSLNDNYDYITSGNNTIWCYFGISEDLEDMETLLLIAFIVICFSFIFVIIIKGRK